MIFNQEQKKIIGKFFVSILALLLIIMCYSYAIPRTEVEIDTVYHSSYSALFVQSKITNAGTEDITGLIVKSSVWNKTEMMISETHYPNNLKSKESVKIPPLVFDGAHADEYDLIIIIEFNGKDGKKTIIYNYKIADYGNLAWHDQYLKF